MDLPIKFWKSSIMQLYEIYQNIVLGTSISCVVGLAVAWVLFLSNRNKWRLNYSTRQYSSSFTLISTFVIPKWDARLQSPGMTTTFLASLTLLLCSSPQPTFRSFPQVCSPESILCFYRCPITNAEHDTVAFLMPADYQQEALPFRCHLRGTRRIWPS